MNLRKALTALSPHLQMLNWAMALVRDLSVVNNEVTSQTGLSIKLQAWLDPWDFTSHGLLSLSSLLASFLVRLFLRGGKLIPSPHWLHPRILPAEVEQLFSVV